MTIIGIDLGTTNSLVSVFLNNECVIIPNALGNRLTPSVVGVMDDGAVIIGEAAKERLISHPNLTEAVFKRHMGSKNSTNLAKSYFPLRIFQLCYSKHLKRMLRLFGYNDHRSRD